ncbi:MAG: hypothetical protein RQ736_13065 [Thiogranum sp.]|nr:hypothetical protein [Thiogranum sp.]
MSHSKQSNDRMLHAYVDRELSSDEKQTVLSQLESDEQWRARACDLQRTKEWVQFSFENEMAPTRTLPRINHFTWTGRTIRLAASVALSATVFVAGWVGHGLHEEHNAQATLEDIAPESRHVILHIGESSEARFAQLLKKTEKLLSEYSARGIEVEVVTNAGGIDLVRTAASQHIDDIKRLISHYPNVRFIACARGLERLRKSGQDVSVVDGVYTGEAAADHLIQRLTEGWTLVTI